MKGAPDFNGRDKPIEYSVRLDVKIFGCFLHWGNKWWSGVDDLCVAGTGQCPVPVFLPIFPHLLRDTGEVFFTFLWFFYSWHKVQGELNWKSSEKGADIYWIKRTAACDGREPSLRCVSLHDGVPTLAQQNRSCLPWVPVHQTILSKYLHFSQLRKAFKHVIKSYLNQWNLSTSLKLNTLKCPAEQGGVAGRRGKAHLCCPFWAGKCDVRSQV